VKEVVNSKIMANELVREGVVVVICDYLIKECQHILERRNKRKKDCGIMRRNILGASNTLLNGQVKIEICIKII